MKMNNITSLLFSGRTLMVALASAFAVSCTTQDDFVNPVGQPAPAEELATSKTDVASLTVAGSFVEYSDDINCAECGFVVPEDATTIDAAKEGIKAGGVICLKKSFNYGAIEIVNVDGTAEKPVTIANCGE